MGLFRKTLSISTLGAIDLRSDKERIARNTRLTKQAVQKNNRLIAEQNEILSGDPDLLPHQVRQAALEAQLAEARANLAAMRKK